MVEGDNFQLSNMLQILIDNLTLPCVTTMLISSSYSKTNVLFRGEWPRESFARFFERSRCSLKVLHLSAIILSDRDAIALLKLCPLLEELHLKEVLHTLHKCSGDGQAESDARPLRIACTSIKLVTSMFLRALHAYNSNDELKALSSPLVPKLQRLELATDGAFFEDHVLLDMIISRWVPDERSASIVGVSCLGSVSIHVLKRRMEIEVAKKLLYLGQAGLKVSIREKEEEAKA
ncbi:hypothetical protein VKT23_011081 [Stygiomarasmius scandens]|uniref:Uncharacterized protein n=1 Tax=Marasmiellus scandens TaxID=2682957 RepID=A0ABR1JFG2_9AGAR